MTGNNSFADKAINYFLNLSGPLELPSGVSVMNPYKIDEVRNIVIEFYKNYLSEYVKVFNSGE